MDERSANFLGGNTEDILSERRREERGFRQMRGIPGGLRVIDRWFAAGTENSGWMKKRSGGGGGGRQKQNPPSTLGCESIS